MEARSRLNTKLRELQYDIVAMGTMVCDAILMAVQALRDRDLDLAQRVVSGDSRINDKRFAIEDKCIRLMATQQPIASDLRIIVAVLNIISEVERIGDYAAGIAQIAILTGKEPPVKPLVDIPRMADQAVDMLRRSLDAFFILDAGAAHEICCEDAMVDETLNRVIRDLMGIMSDNSLAVARATRLIWAAQNLARCADRATNICERIIFVITGKMEETEGPQY